MSNVKRPYTFIKTVTYREVRVVYAESEQEAEALIERGCKSVLIDRQELDSFGDCQILTQDS